MVTTTSPPGIRTVSVPLAAPAYDSAATAAATVPVPQERVSPTPRSCTRMLTAPSDGAVRTSTLTPSGNCALSNVTGAATSRAASEATVNAGSTQARRGLPTATASPLKVRPPTTACPAPTVLVLPMSTLTSALVASTQCRTTGLGPASDPTTNSSRDSNPLARR